MIKGKYEKSLHKIRWTIRAFESPLVLEFMKLCQQDIDHIIGLLATDFKLLELFLEQIKHRV
jgi:hypothetical protein